MRIRAVAVVATLAMTTLAACGGDDDDPTMAADTEETSSSASTAEDDDETSQGEHNEADVTFARSMIPHHSEAIEMAQLAPERAESPDVLDLAARIEAAQQPEIEQMESWLEAWGESDGTAMDMDDMGSMPGAMSEEDMAALEAASGAEFDRMFLEMMVEHHRGAISMAETEVAEGAFPDAVALAEKIIEDQQAEIAEIEAMLAELG